MRRLANRSLILFAVAVSFPTLLFGAPGQKKQDADRPKLPYQMLGLHQEDIDAYDSKAEPVATAMAAILTTNRAGWQLIRKYFPELGINSEEREKAAHPEDRSDRRFVAHYTNEGPGFSPMPLLCMVWSLPGDKLSGPLKSLHDELASAMTLEDYSSWNVDRLRREANDRTEAAVTPKGVKYRRPKPRLTFAQALRLQAMTLALLRIDNKWANKTDKPSPDMRDFTNRLTHEMPQRIADAATGTFFLYIPGALEQPLAKGDFAERADVVVVKRDGMTFEIEQFPVFLTAEPKEWSPHWITEEDEVNDATLIARKYEHDWTRLDGPYLWYRPDLLVGEDVYRGTVKFEGDKIDILAERFIQRRAAVKRVERPPDYDLSRAAAFLAEKDEVATPFSPYIVESSKMMSELNQLKQPTRYFSNGFRAWCSYGRWDSGVASDGRTYVFVADEPRQVTTSSVNSQQPLTGASKVLMHSAPDVPESAARKPQ